MNILEVISGMLEGTAASGLSNPILGMALILGLIIGLRILVRIANVTIKLGGIALGIMAILWILSSMA